MRIHMKGAPDRVAARRRAIALYVAGEKVDFICAETGIPRGQFRQDCRRAGIPARTDCGRQKHPLLLRAKLAWSYMLGASSPEVSDRFSVSPGAVTNACRELGVGVRRPGPRPTAVDKAVVALTVDMGKDPKDVAREMGLRVERVRALTARAKAGRL